MRTICKIVGFALFYISTIIMFLFWFSAMTKWLGFIGSILAIIIAPGLVIFPIIFWVVEGVFPAFYFIIWGIGIIGIIIAMLSSANESRY